MQIHSKGIIKIEFDDLPGREIGFCQIYPNAFKISVDRIYWNAVNDTDRFSLLVHELCHCEFDIPHYLRGNAMNNMVFY